LGALPPLPIATPWWQDIAPVVAAFRQRHRFTPLILRLVSAERPAPPGGLVTYLAEVDGPVSGTQPWPATLSEHPLRLAYARPGGPQADLAWARAKLDQPLTGPPIQVRTWNLSSLWRLPTPGGEAWLKVVPPFFAHEGAVLTALAGEAVPALLAADGPRMLLAQVPGRDLYFAGRRRRGPMIDLLVALQRRWLGRTDELLALGALDCRAAALGQRIASLADRLKLGAAFAASLPRRFAALADCGPGDGLVHGDFHPGNFRGRGDELTLLDWGDVAIGHPLLDVMAFVDRIPEASRPIALRRWKRRWRGVDFDRAWRLIAPLEAARRACVYQGFLDHIEPSEHPYHAGDPRAWLERAIALAN
jgi:hypothetical protein